MANNQYHRYLKLPVDLGGSIIDLCKANGLLLKEISELQHFKIRREYFPDKFNSWFAHQGIQFNNVEVFVCPPGLETQIHSDVTDPTSTVTKINIVEGGSGSQMNWFTPKNEKSHNINISMIGTQYITLEPDEAKLVHRAPITQPSLLDVSAFHNVSNTSSEYRYCVSMPLYYVDTNKRVTFQEALEIFKGYIQ